MVAGNSVGSYKRNVVLRLQPGSGAVLDVVAARGELQGLAGIAFAPDGTLWVSSYEDNRVVSFNVSHAARAPWQALARWEARAWARTRLQAQMRALERAAAQAWARWEARPRRRPGQGRP